ncbi:vasotab-TY1-like [Eupeodes corollae]|uniref:vasotab-TY1-like n=1 Tax=Eupeodes corollae TaxID=290404 RepID=UPI002491FA18|nr:vasotab-TY1-like [Eupeodes corollae]
MKVFIFVLFTTACLLAVTYAQNKNCDAICSEIFKPVCATKDKGKTYRTFGNSCHLGNENCKTKNAYKTVDIKKCK